MSYLGKAIELRQRKKSLVQFLGICDIKIYCDNGGADKEIGLPESMENKQK